MTFKALKIRKFIFKLTSATYYLLTFALAVLILYYHQPESIGGWIGAIIGLFVGYVVFCGLTAILENQFGENIFSFLSAPSFTYVSKITYHPELGYFIMFFEQSDNKLTINCFKQGFLSRRLIFSEEIYQATEQNIIEKTKSKLDNIYKEKIKAQKERIEREEYYSKVKSTIDAWDGYLDKVSRRDAKIDKIVNK